MKISELLYLIKWDTKVNWGASFDSLRAVLMLIEIRLEQFIYSNLGHLPMPVKLIWFFVRFLGSIFQWFLCNSNIPGTTIIGRGLRLPHPQNIIVVFTAQIGEFCTLYQNTTIARNGFEPIQWGTPRIGDFVLIGTNSVILGNIEIGSDVLIGAGSIVVDSIPDHNRVTGGKPVISKRHMSQKAADPGSKTHLHDPYSIWR